MNLTSEEKLLFYSSCPSFFEKKCEILISLIKSGIDWRSMESLLQKKPHLDEMLPGLFYHLNKLELLTLVPRDFYNRIKLEYFQNSARNLVFLNELMFLLKKLAEKGINAVPFKGGDFIKRIYPVPGIRKMEDLDLLVPENVLGKSIDVLEKAGFSYIETNDGNHCTFLKERRGHQIFLEVHWDLINRNSPAQKYAFQIQMEEIYKNLKSVNMDGLNLPVLSTEDYLLYLSAHLVKESFRNYKWFGDVYELTLKDEGFIDWEKLISDARGYRVDRTLYYTLDMVKRNLDADQIPQKVLESLRPERMGNLEKLFYRRLLGKRTLPKSLTYWVLINGLKGKAGFLYGSFGYLWWKTKRAVREI